ncbi:hypothetical protein GGTG_06577 [Gaeumannomyces tritici R3-111a-1]|uniref:PA14 domain-containing protein n=1 Tax=Gaeumannomyces tritici (strain R3-111a-1) TaxID=644352 RepID=J3NZ77_GAET3|nr:hypothetical protein GGTG_06577 [Gaeumannomyces tritici R3-111a-1]EJT76660.1 hypothetical protein GGTG_06577 [Gaeumannomyces tritici R3-111a-1]
MKATFSLAGLAFAGAALAGYCNNNCGRAVAGTAKGDTYEARRSECAAFLATTTTVTPTTVTATTTLAQAPAVTERNVHGRRDQAAGANDAIPTFASMCKDVTAYWNACYCFAGMTSTTVTVTAPTPTSTVTETPAPPAAPTCTPGLEWAAYYFDRASDKGQMLWRTAAQSVNNLNTPLILQGATPLRTGVTEAPGVVFQTNYSPGVPFSAYGSPIPGTNIWGSLIVHRGYIRAGRSGTYSIYMPHVDDTLVAWIGDRARSGFTIADATFKLNENSIPPSRAWSFDLAAGDVVPFRLFWSNGGGPGGLNIQIRDPAGNVISGQGAAGSSQIITSCSGAGAPAAASAWPAWESEVVGGVPT